MNAFETCTALGIAAAVACLQIVNAAEPVSPKVPEALAFLPPGNVKFSGWIGEHIEVCKRGRIMAQSVSDLVRPFALREEIGRASCRERV